MQTNKFKPSTGCSVDLRLINGQYTNNEFGSLFDLFLIYSRKVIYQAMPLEDVYIM